MDGMMICPNCGTVREEHQPFDIFTCYRCGVRFKPIKKVPEYEEDTILTTIGWREVIVA